MAQRLFLNNEQSPLINAEDTNDHGHITRDDHGNVIQKKNQKENFGSIKNKKKDQTPSKNNDEVRIEIDSDQKNHFIQGHLSLLESMPEDIFKFIIKHLLMSDTHTSTDSTSKQAPLYQKISLIKDPNTKPLYRMLISMTNLRSVNRYFKQCIDDFFKETDHLDLGKVFSSLSQLENEYIRANKNHSHEIQEEQTLLAKRRREPSYRSDINCSHLNPITCCFILMLATAGALLLLVGSEKQDFGLLFAGYIIFGVGGLISCANLFCILMNPAIWTLLTNLKVNMGERRINELNKLINDNQTNYASEKSKLFTPLHNAFEKNGFFNHPKLSAQEIQSSIEDTAADLNDGYTVHWG